MAIDETFTVRIGRPPAEVFEHLIDVERWPEWLIATGIVAVERQNVGASPAADVDPLAVGSRLRIQQVVAGVRSSSVDASVTALDAPTHVAVSGKDADGVGVELDARLEPDGQGTGLTWRIVVRLPFRLRIFEGMARPQVRRAAALDLEAFKRRLESVAGD